MMKGSDRLSKVGDKSRSGYLGIRGELPSPLPSGVELCSISKIFEEGGLKIETGRRP